MNHFVLLVLAVAVSLAIIPLMAQLAPRLGLIDAPEARKVHARPIPRVGGWGIVIGSLVALLMWVPLTPLVQTYALGALVLFAFGAWDDRREMGHWAKFGGQLAAVLPLVTYGGLYVTQVPFIDGPLPPAVAIPFTVVALMGMINAVNHSDGLDGLAGGESILSLAAIGYLAAQADSALGAALAVTCIGGLLGFLRYNTHPATLFMGDSGSQFLGFTLGMLAIILTQRADPSLSPAVVLLLLGLPIADILVVLYRRVSGGMNWFRATRNHVHHRLLALGFEHRDAVIVIYSVHTLLVGSGILLRHASDWLIIGVYLGVTGTLFGFLEAMERRRDNRPLGEVLRHVLLVVAPRRLLSVAVPVLLVGIALWVDRVPLEFGLAAAAVGALLLLDALLVRSPRSLARRGLVYMAAAFALFLHGNERGAEPLWARGAELGFFATLLLALVVAVAFSPRRRRFEFHATATDYLLLFLAGSMLLLAPWSQLSVGLFLVELAVVFYACELLSVERRPNWNELNLGALGATAILALRGVL